MVEYAENALKVAAVIWNGMDLMDITGPAEVLSWAMNGQGQKLCSLKIAAEDEISLPLPDQNMGIQRQCTVDELLSELYVYDVLIIPGGVFQADDVPKVPSLDKVVHAFASLPPRNGTEGPRILMSICAGAFWLASAGLLAGRIATTHHVLLQGLQEVANQHGNDTRVVRAHYVDGGLDETHDLHIITSGGITSGMDATLYMLQLKFGIDVADRSADAMDYTWRREVLPYGFASSP